MTVLITSATTSEHGTYVEATCEKVSALVCLYPDRVQVCCKNAAHKAFRGAGKFFVSVRDALDNYRSGEMKAIIQAAVDYSTKPATAPALAA